MSELTFRVKKEQPEVVFQPRTYQGMRRGIHQVLDAVKSTLGPLPRMVAVEKYTIGTPPEILDSGALIARRIIDLPDRDANTGAMILRGMLYRLNERVGDGTTTAAILFASVFDQCLRFIEAGGNPMILTRHLESGLKVILDTLDGMVIHVDSQQALSGVARTVCHDEDLARMLGEIFYTIGEFGLLEVRTGRGREHHREFVLGHYWPSTGMIVDRLTESTVIRKDVENAGVFISDFEMKEPPELAPVLRAAVLGGYTSLVLIVQSLSDQLKTLIQQSQKSSKLTILPVKAPFMRAEQQKDGLLDIAQMTGGKPFFKAAGVSAERIEAGDLGKARRFWADKESFSLMGGGGDPRALRVHLRRLRASFEAQDDREKRDWLANRIGRIMGGAANFEVGGITEPEIKMKRDVVKRAEATVRAAVRSGLLPGGGVALLNCQDALRRKLTSIDDFEQATAYKILIQALEAPFRMLMHNCGLDETAILGRVRQMEPGCGYDILSKQYGRMDALGVLDVADVVSDGVRTAVKTAALALSVDVVIRKKDPVVMQNPE
ncbi:MAG: hypothetical protein JW750_06915 [Anaerolineaceae bacterium]|nr:hypothetical protein [Anaerolineaceae bacterium]